MIVGILIGVMILLVLGTAGYATIAVKQNSPHMSRREHRASLDYKDMREAHEAFADIEQKRRWAAIFDEIHEHHEGRKRKRHSPDQTAVIDAQRVREVNQMAVRIRLGPKGGFGRINSDGTVKGGHRRFGQFAHHEPFPQNRERTRIRPKREKKEKKPRTKVPLRTSVRIRTKR